MVVRVEVAEGGAFGPVVDFEGGGQGYFLFFLEGGADHFHNFNKKLRFDKYKVRRWDR